MTGLVACRGRPRRRVLPSRRSDSGLIALEWLLIVGAVASLAASSVLIGQRVVGDAAEVPVDPLVRILEADIAAAFVAAEAQSAFDQSLQQGSPPYIVMDRGFRERCLTDLRAAFDDVVYTFVWTTPADPNNTPDNTGDDEPALCVATPRPDLGGS